MAKIGGEKMREIILKMIKNNFDAAKVSLDLADYGTAGETIYPASLHLAEGCAVFLARINGEKKLVAVAQAESKLFAAILPEQLLTIESMPVKIAELSHANACVLRKFFSFMNPVAFGRNSFSLGLGDRLGLASPGHLHCLEGTPIRPVLAQQSIRELVLTHRTYEDVLDAASWAVLQEGFHGGFGADGDHLKKPEEIKMALDLGFSMITLDCSEKIDGKVATMTKDELAAKYMKLDPKFVQEMEGAYLGKNFSVGTNVIRFDRETLQEILLTYGATLAFIKEINETFIKNHKQPVDFELSIDETMTPTTPAAHYFMAAETEKAGIVLYSVAPRFCGEFQKGIDYIGDLSLFEADFAAHAAIADHFGYKISVHSGSDKFSVFPIVGQYTKGRVHVKTAGTNWLEALRVVCRKDPKLFREICDYAHESFAEATKLYHVTTDLKKIPKTSEMTDEQLERMLNEPDARQLLHITYGQILTDKDANGKTKFRDRLYAFWNQHEKEYSEVLEVHIGKHIKTLMSKM